MVTTAEEASAQNRKTIILATTIAIITTILETAAMVFILYFTKWIGYAILGVCVLIWAILFLATRNRSAKSEHREAHDSLDEALTQAGQPKTILDCLYVVNGSKQGMRKIVACQNGIVVRLGPNEGRFYPWNAVENVHPINGQSLEFTLPADGGGRQAVEILCNSKMKITLLLNLIEHAK